MRYVIMIHVPQVAQMPQIQTQYIFAQNAKKESTKAVDTSWGRKDLFA
ncbi:MAG: hypothetical protein KHY93_07515 [Clostridiales bacterium]|nr:hypothetical protein [Clostridiales bacterium]